MFIKQVMFTKQNTKQKFTNTLRLQNKTKVYIQVMFIKKLGLTNREFETKLHSAEFGLKLFKNCCVFVPDKNTAIFD